MPGSTRARPRRRSPPSRPAGARTWRRTRARRGRAPRAPSPRHGPSRAGRVVEDLEVAPHGHVRHAELADEIRDADGARLADALEDQGLPLARQHPTRSALTRPGRARRRVGLPCPATASDASRRQSQRNRTSIAHVRTSRACPSLTSAILACNNPLVATGPPMSRGQARGGAMADPDRDPPGLPQDRPEGRRGRRGPRRPSRPSSRRADRRVRRRAERRGVRRCGQRPRRSPPPAAPRHASRRQQPLRPRRSQGGMEADQRGLHDGDRHRRGPEQGRPRHVPGPDHDVPSGTPDTAYTWFSGFRMKFFADQGLNDGDRRRVGEGQGQLHRRLRQRRSSATTARSTASRSTTTRGRSSTARASSRRRATRSPTTWDDLKALRHEDAVGRPHPDRVRRQGRLARDGHVRHPQPAASTATTSTST